jgi:hypothetical protein
MKPNPHTHCRSLGRKPGRTAAVGAAYDRIERIGFSVRLLAIGVARVPQPGADCKYEVVTKHSCKGSSTSLSAKYR